MTIYHYNGRHLIFSGDGDPQLAVTIIWYRLFVHHKASGSIGFRGARGKGAALKITYPTARAMARASREIRVEYPEIVNGGVME